MKKIYGIIPAILTPFTPKGEVDEEALRKLIIFYLRKGVHGLYPCGSLGSGPLMTVEMRKKVAEIVIDEVDGKIPVIVHCGAADTFTTIELSDHAKECGAEAVGVVTPYYYGARLDKIAIIEHYKKISEAVDVPIFVYNFPRCTGFNITPDLLNDLAKNPRIVGIKDSSGNFTQLCEYLNILGEKIIVLTGSDAFIFPGYLAGCKGAISAVAVVFPELVVNLWKACVKNNYHKARELHHRILAARRVLRGQPYLTSYYEALKILGHNVGTSRPPLRRITNQEREKLRNNLAALGLLPR